jgi:hypothetical protein
MAFWKKNEPADPDDGVQVTPLPGGGRQETFIDEDGVTPVASEFIDKDGNSVRVEHYDVDGNIIATEGD